MDAIGTVRVQEPARRTCLVVEIKLGEDDWVAYYIDQKTGEYGTQRLSDGVAVGALDGVGDKPREVVYKPNPVEAAPL